MKKLLVTLLLALSLCVSSMEPAMARGGRDGGAFVGGLILGGAVGLYARPPVIVEPVPYPVYIAPEPVPSPYYGQTYPAPGWNGCHIYNWYDAYGWHQQQQCW